MRGLKHWADDARGNQQGTHRCLRSHNITWNSFGVLPSQSVQIDGDNMKFEMSNHIAIQVKDLKKATEFYKDVMGMEVLKQDDGEAEIRCGSMVFHAESSEQGKTFFDFKVSDLEEAKDCLEA